ncbi:hypothetical protein SPWS13_4411 [Shewanella putrefaciens]|nr:hypothetical protein SPWS13_4411 [Shewanella putrefaciens]
MYPNHLNPAPSGGLGIKGHDSEIQFNEMGYLSHLQGLL